MTEETNKPRLSADENPNAKYMKMLNILDKHWSNRNRQTDRELMLSGNDEQMIFECMMEYADQEKAIALAELEQSISHTISLHRSNSEFWSGQYNECSGVLNDVKIELAAKTKELEEAKIEIEFARENYKDYLVKYETFENQLAERDKQIELLVRGLTEIRYWSDDEEEQYGDPFECAKHFLKLHTTPGKTEGYNKQNNEG